MGGEYEFALQLPQKEKEVGIAQVDEAGVTPEVHFCASLAKVGSRYQGEANTMRKILRPSKKGLGLSPSWY